MAPVNHKLPRWLPAAAVLLVSLGLIIVALARQTISWIPFWSGVLLYMVGAAWWIALWAKLGPRIGWRLAGVWLPTAPLLLAAVASLSIALRTQDEAGLAAELFGGLAFPLTLFSVFGTIHLLGNSRVPERR